MSLSTISSELKSRINELNYEIKLIKDKYLAEHNERPERDYDWHVIAINWNHMILERMAKIDIIQKELREAIEC